MANNIPKASATKQTRNYSHVLGTRLPTADADPGAGTPVTRTDLRNTAANSVGGKPQRVNVTVNRVGGGSNW